jgi:hypothetical protein
MKLLEVIEQKSKKKTILESVPENLSRAEGIVQVADNRWLLVVDNGDSVFGFENQADANTALDEFTRPGANRDDFDRQYQNNRRTSRFNRATDAVSEDEFNRRVRRSSTLQRYTAKPLFGVMNGILRLAGPISGAYFGIIAAAAEIEDDPDLSPAEKQEQIGILYGLLVTEVTAILVLILGRARLARRFINLARGFTRAATITLSASGIGTLPGIVGLIASEAAWWAVSWLLTNARVQRALAQWMAGTFVGDLFGFIGDAVQAGAAALDEATNGLIGSRDLRRWLGFPDRDGDAELRSAAHGSSEWAKLVIGAIMYPPQADPIVVPYISPQRREALLAEALSVNVQEIDFVSPDETDAPANDTVPLGSEDDTQVVPGETPTPPETPADRSRRTREQSLRTDYSNPNFTRAQPFTGPR